MLTIRRCRICCRRRGGGCDSKVWLEVYRSDFDDGQLGMVMTGWMGMMRGCDVNLDTMVFLFSSGVGMVDRS